MHNMHSGAFGGQNRASDLLELKVGSCEPACWYWELNPVLLGDQQVVLTPEPSLQPLIYYVYVYMCAPA